MGPGLQGLKQENCLKIKTTLVCSVRPCQKKERRRGEEEEEEEGLTGKARRFSFRTKSREEGGMQGSLRQIS